MIKISSSDLQAIIDEAVRSAVQRINDEYGDDPLDDYTPAQEDDFDDEGPDLATRIAEQSIEIEESLEDDYADGGVG